jgi:hypothetical protein
VKLCRLEDVRRASEQVRTLNPDFSLEKIRSAVPFRNEDQLEGFMDALSVAGLEG